MTSRYYAKHNHTWHPISCWRTSLTKGFQRTLDYTPKIGRALFANDLGQALKDNEVDAAGEDDDDDDEQSLGATTFATAQSLGATTFATAHTSNTYSTRKSARKNKGQIVKDPNFRSH